MDSRDYEDAYQRDDAPREVKSNRAWRLECESLRQQLAECRKDAERYRYLRGKSHSMDVVQWMLSDHGWQVNILGDYATIDEAIDAALAKLGAEKTGEKR